MNESKIQWLYGIKRRGMNDTLKPSEGRRERRGREQIVGFRRRLVLTELASKPYEELYQRLRFLFLSTAFAWSGSVAMVEDTLSTPSGRLDGSKTFLTGTPI